MYYLWVALFAVVLLLCWGLTALGLPGNWFIVGIAALFAYLFPAEAGQGMGWSVVAALVGLALLGELLEFVAGAAGMSKGGSKRGALLAIVGSFLGSILGASVGLPIPIVGSLVGILLFSSLGAMAGAFLGERWVGRQMDHSLSIGKAAFWGRLFGSVAKIIVGSIMAAVAVVAALF